MGQQVLFALANYVKHLLPDERMSFDFLYLLKPKKKSLPRAPDPQFPPSSALRSVGAS